MALQRKKKRNLVLCSYNVPTSSEHYSALTNCSPVFECGVHWRTLADSVMDFVEC